MRPKLKTSPLGFGFRFKPIPENKERKERGLALGFSFQLRADARMMQGLSLRLAEDADPEMIKREDRPWDLALCNKPTRN
jgi:hypothetical protein